VAKFTTTALLLGQPAGSSQWRRHQRLRHGSRPRSRTEKGAKLCQDKSAHRRVYHLLPPWELQRLCLKILVLLVCRNLYRTISTVAGESVTAMMTTLLMDWMAMLLLLLIIKTMNRQEPSLQIKKQHFSMRLPLFRELMKLILIPNLLMGNL